MKIRNHLTTCVDIGNSKTCAIIAQMDPETGNPLIKGYGTVETKGFKKGAVVNIEELSHTISQAVNTAESMADTTVSSCFVNLGGDHIRSMNTQGLIAISRDARGAIGEAREVEKEDIDQVIEHTKAVPLPVDRQILHVLPQEFTVDEQSGIKNPINLLGRRLELKVHITTYSTTVASNLERCFKNVDLKVTNFIFNSLASAESVLTPSEKESGTILIDIGNGTVDVIVYADGGVHHTGVVNFGDQMVSSDIAYLLRIPIEYAEKIKKNHGYSFTKNVDQETMIKIDSIGTRPARELPLMKLAEFIEPRMEEILREAFMESKKADIPMTSIQSVVLTGGGALIKGCEELAESIFNIPTRVGFPSGYTGFEDEINNPKYATAIGMLKFAFQNKSATKSKPSGSDNWFDKTWKWLKNISENIM